MIDKDFASGHRERRPRTWQLRAEAMAAIDEDLEEMGQAVRVIVRAELDMASVRQARSARRRKRRRVPSAS